MTAPSERAADLVRRLRGEYRIPITDGLGATGGGVEPDNPREFVRRFETPPIQKEAAAFIEDLIAASASAFGLSCGRSAGFDGADLKRAVNGGPLPIYGADGQPARDAAVLREYADGERVEKFTGEARWLGTIRAFYLTGKGSPRYVVEVEPQGFQMIAVPNQLRRAAAIQASETAGKDSA